MLKQHDNMNSPAIFIVPHPSAVMQQPQDTLEKIRKKIEASSPCNP